jgi:hypothetical protein
MNLSPHDQIDNHSRTCGALTMGRRVGDCDYRPARVGQGGCHPVSVGEAASSFHGLARCLTSTVNWPERFANRRSGLFPHSRVARASLSVEPRRRVQGFSSPLAHGSVATLQFVRAVMAARRQFKTSSHKFARQSTESLGLHLERLSCGPVAYEQTKPRKVPHSAGKTSQGLGNV